MMGVVTWSVIVGAVTFVLTYVIIRLVRFILWVRMISRSLTKLPGPKPHWFFGNVLQIEDFSKFLLNMHEQQIVQSNAKAYVFWLFRFQPITILCHPETIKQVLRGNAPKTTVGPGYPFLVPWLGQSLLISNGPKWERNRRLLTPAFHFSILTGYFKIYNEVAETLMNKLESKSKDGAFFDIFKPAGIATLDTLLQCSLGYQGNVQNFESHPYVTAVNRLLVLLNKRSYNIHHYPEFLYRLSSDGREFFRLVKYVHDFSDKIITARRKELSLQNGSIKTEKRKHLDFLDILLTAQDENGVGMTNEEIRNEVDTFLFAGHDTTSSVLSWSIYSLAKNKEVQDKVYTEVKEVMGKKTNIDSEDIPKLKYLTCFLKEVMRKHTPVPIINRTLDEPICIDGVELPAGVMVDCCMFHSHNHPDVWNSPEKFSPDRFQDDRHHEMDPYSFTPFSAGPRNCIGMNFAQNEEKALIARIVERFEISLDPDHVIEPFLEVVMRAKNGIMVNFKRRKN